MILLKFVSMSGYFSRAAAAPDSAPTVTPSPSMLVLYDNATKNIAFQQKIEIASKRTTREKIMAYLTEMYKIQFYNSMSYKGH